jgi:hypothetical protein
MGRGLVGGPLDLGEVDAFFDHLVEGESSRRLTTTFDDFVGDVIDFCLGVEAAEAEADGAVGYVVAEAESLENVAGLEGGRGAGEPELTAMSLMPMRRDSPST